MDEDLHAEMTCLQLLCPRQVHVRLMKAGTISAFAHSRMRKSCADISERCILLCRLQSFKPGLQRLM